MDKYHLGFCIPEVYDIFRFKQTGDIWFSMRPYDAALLSNWCLANSGRFGELILQIALTLEVVENVLFIDHRDLKVNNILVVDNPVEIRISWKGKAITLNFPFHIVYVDFGYACAKGLVDVRDGLPAMDLCPKDGRDIYQILVSLWRIKDLRGLLNTKWGAWIRSKIDSTLPQSYLNLVETTFDLSWMYSVTDNTGFRAPLCKPAAIINDCMSILSLE
jgi:serine/threonine protein kinase